MLRIRDQVCRSVIEMRRSPYVRFLAFRTSVRRVLSDVDLLMSRTLAEDADRDVRLFSALAALNVRRSGCNTLTSDEVHAESAL